MKNIMGKIGKYLYPPVDIVMIAVSYLLALFFQYDDWYTAEYLTPAFHSVLIASVVYLAVFAINRIYRYIVAQSLIRYFVKVTLTSLICNGFIIIADLMIPYTLSAKLNLLALVFCTVTVAGYRVIVKVFAILGQTYYVKRNNTYEQKRLLIYGSGDAATIIIRDIERNPKLAYKIIGLMDDDKLKKNRIVCGYQVLGTRHDLKYICSEKQIDEIIVAIPSAADQDVREIIQICSETGCKVKRLPAMDQILNRDSSLYQKVREVSIEDLLERDPIVLDNEGLLKELKEQVILVTGGGGSIGSELCRQIAKYQPKTLIVLDIYENNAYDLQMELAEDYPDLDLRVVIASVRDVQRMEQVFEKYHPAFVFHAAAHKHVPLMEFNPGEAIKNNVFGTYHTAMCANKYKVKRFVLISTDKAVNPTNIMGATKRICEMVIQAMQTISNTEFVAVRFGNVLGSNGSVVPLFKRQIAKGRPITVTHKNITRFFMTIPEAAQLVLQAANYAQGGEIFVLDMGKPVKIYDLAVNLVNLSGLRPNKDIQIEITGLRPGEKLYEELLMNEEGLIKTQHSKIFIGKPIFNDMAVLKQYLHDLEEVMKSNDSEKIKDAVSEIVPTYVRKKPQSEEVQEKKQPEKEYAQV